MYDHKVMLKYILQNVNFKKPYPKYWPELVFFNLPGGKL